jgi:hypothetical protein
LKPRAKIAFKGAMKKDCLQKSLRGILLKALISEKDSPVCGFSETQGIKQGDNWTCFFEISTRY